MAPSRFSGGARCSWRHRIAAQRANGGYMIFGSKLTSPRGFDLRPEGCLVSIDGEDRAAACGFEAMRNPLNVVAAMAAKLSEIGEKLHAGQQRVARLHFQTLGDVTVRLPAGAMHRNFNVDDTVERHISLLIPEPRPGEILDFAVTVHEGEATLMQSLPT